MRVKFFAYLRDYTGCSETDAPHVPTMGDLARNLCERYGKKLREKMLTKSGELGPEIIIMINGRHIAHLGGLDAPLKSDDTVQIFPMVAGG
ncbi:MAG: MoaD/ThiS family protein [Treponema sp.]|nr:MoaD/ThiS family protein [Treponema sp.]